jgi:transcriptional regulator with XRE-family HTH domain
MYLFTQRLSQYPCISAHAQNRWMESIGDRIKRTRKSQGLTQEGLAKRVGISQGTIGHIEAGRNSDSKHVIRIATALNVNAEWLQSGRGEGISQWPFPGVTPEEYDMLAQADKEEIAAIVRMKIARIAVKKTG